jgi:hypothetical protein
MRGLFFRWLQSADPVVADFLSRKGIPQQSSKLSTLLAKCGDSSVRHVVKVWHRQWRKSRRSFKTFQITPDMVTTAPTNFDFENIGLKKTGDFNITLNFGPSECQMCKGEGKLPLKWPDNPDWPTNAIAECPMCNGEGQV